MQYFSAHDQKVTVRDLEEQSLRVGANEIFLPLLHYILVDYSTELFVTILDYVPNVKCLSDRNFVESALRIAAKVLGVEAGLTVEQFLTNKYFEKKLEFVSGLAKGVY
jgi:hypothetical protein